MKFIKWIFLAPIVLIGVIFVLLIGKMTFDHYYAEYWKNKTEELCKKDAGVTVYEKITLLPESKHIVKYNNESDDFYLKIPYKKDIEPGHEFYRTYNSSRIKDGNLKVSRAVYEIIRIKDSKIISKKIDYSGAIHFILASGPYTFGCNSLPGFKGDLTGDTFTNANR